MARESVQRKLDRVRPPRVHITYDVETGGAIEAREVAFVIGVMGDYSGAAERPTKFAQGRGFQQVDFDSFDQLLAELNPRASFKIPSSLTEGEMTVDLVFRSLADFEPEHVIEQLAPLDPLRKSGSPEDLQTIARHLDRVLHAPEFQALESAWRSLWYLVFRTETSASMRIRVLDVTKRELLRDFQRAPEFDQSRLFKLLYDEPYDQFYGDPFGLLVGDFAFGPSGEDMELLERFGCIAAACHAPFIAGAAPSMLGLESFRSLSAMRDPAGVSESPEFARWKAFRKSEEARYVGLVLPRCLVRGPYGIRPSMPGEFQYEEDFRDGQHLLWGSAAFPFAACVANAFTRYGWCGAIRGVEGGGMVEGLPTWISHTDDGTEVRSALEIGITDRREKELSDLGFLPLLTYLNSDYAAFFSVSSCASPKQYESDAANVNSRLSCQLPYVLTASRFVHYLKVISRDRLGSYHSRGEWEKYFNRWISNYVIPDDHASPAIQAQHPLREARIEVAEDLGKPGSYRLVAFLRPTFQLDELSVSLRVVTHIP
jgi:type VI secretion system protein ImpC